MRIIPFDNFYNIISIMSPFLFSMGQDTIDRVHREEIVRQHIEEFGIPPSVTGHSSRTNPTVVGDEADFSVNSAIITTIYNKALQSFS